MTQPQAPTDTLTDTETYARDLLATVRPGACVFDFDGTLVDTSTINADAARATLADLGLTVPEPWLRQAPWPTSPHYATGCTLTTTCPCPARKPNSCTAPAPTGSPARSWSGRSHV